MSNGASTSLHGFGQPELIVVAKPEAGLRALARGLDSVTSADTRSLTSLLDAAGARMRPLFGLSEDRLRARMAPEAPSGTESGAQPAPDLALYYLVEAEERRLHQLAQDLLASDLVDGAFVKPPGEPPMLFELLNSMQPDAGDAPPATPDFVSRQGYLAMAPTGVDAQFAWTVPGGAGAGVRIIDCEWAWRFTHEDLTQNQGGVVAGTSSGNTDHGTAVVGVISADRNTFGCTGIAPDAVISASSFSDQSTSRAIKAAADKLRAGDIILLEIHRPGPNTPNPPQGQLGFIAIEWWPDDFAAIRYACRKG